MRRRGGSPSHPSAVVRYEAVRPTGVNQACRAYGRAGGMPGPWSWCGTEGWYAGPRRRPGSAAVDEAEGSARKG
jgi:hypothetical protein